MFCYREALEDILFEKPGKTSVVSGRRRSEALGSILMSLRGIHTKNIPQAGHCVMGFDVIQLDAIEGHGDLPRHSVQFRRWEVAECGLPYSR